MSGGVADAADRTVGVLVSDAIIDAALAAAREHRAQPWEMALAIGRLFMFLVEECARYGASTKRFCELMSALARYRKPDDWPIVAAALKAVAERRAP